jgi:hypothetical protein
MPWIRLSGSAIISPISRHEHDWRSMYLSITPGDSRPPGARTRNPRIKSSLRLPGQSRLVLSDVRELFSLTSATGRRLPWSCGLFADRDLWARLTS